MSYKYSKSENWILGLGFGTIGTFLVLLVLVVIGWIMNIVALAGMTDVLSTGKGILRIAGIFFPPLGAIMGWFV